jgi:uncharacterized protein (TIGR03086 family)
MAELDLAEIHERCLAATGRTVSGIKPDQMHRPTPCTEWDVTDLLNHVVSGNLWAAELARGATIEQVGDRLDGDVIGDDPSTAYDRSARAAAEAFNEPGAMDRPCAVSYGPVPGSVYAGHRIIDVLVHGWDLAVATDQDTTLEPELAKACLDIVESQLDQITASGAFGHDDGPPAGADAQTRLLHHLGRGQWLQ